MSPMRRTFADFIHHSIVHPVEAAIAITLYGFFAVLPLDVASAIGGWLGRTVGPRLTLSRRARRNLKLIFPEMTPKEIAVIERGMWDNLGRVAAEFPHISEINVYDPDGPVEVIGVEYIEALRDDGKPGISFSAHFGNWELVSLAATQRGLPLDRIYRAANNRLVEWLYRYGRAAVEGALIPKGPAGVRPILASLRNGNHLALLVDQKMNDGIPVSFLGRTAMTAPALAELALKFNCPVVPARLVRTKGARFKLIVQPPLCFTPSGDRKKDVADLMAEVNAVIGSWVLENPEQWLWLHNRWPLDE